MYCNFGEARRNDMNWGCKGNEVGQCHLACEPVLNALQLESRFF